MDGFGSTMVCNDYTLFCFRDIQSVELPWFVITTMQCVHSDSHSCVDSVSTFQSVYFCQLIQSVHFISTA